MVVADAARKADCEPKGLRRKHHSLYIRNNRQAKTGRADASSLGTADSILQEYDLRQFRSRPDRARPHQRFWIQSSLRSALFRKVSMFRSIRRAHASAGQ